MNKKIRKWILAAFVAGMYLTFVFIAISTSGSVFENGSVFSHPLDTSDKYLTLYYLFNCLLLLIIYLVSKNLKNKLIVQVFTLVFLTSFFLSALVLLGGDGDIVQNAFIFSVAGAVWFGVPFVPYLGILPTLLFLTSPFSVTLLIFDRERTMPS